MRQRGRIGYLIERQLRELLLGRNKSSVVYTLGLNVLVFIL
jgi:hypothetical protein